jgi:hypothetical protein
LGPVVVSKCPFRYLSKFPKQKNKNKNKNKKPKQKKLGKVEKEREMRGENKKVEGTNVRKRKN